MRSLCGRGTKAVPIVSIRPRCKGRTWVIRAAGADIVVPSVAKQDSGQKKWRVTSRTQIAGCVCKSLELRTEGVCFVGWHTKAAFCMKHGVRLVVTLQGLGWSNGYGSKVVGMYLSAENARRWLTDWPRRRCGAIVFLSVFGPLPSRWWCIDS